jgi:ABC-2 type transport system permease protein
MTGAASLARVFLAILRREALKTLGQRTRLLSALVRPMLWLVVFAAGFRGALGLSIQPPYSTYILYETYVVPGLAAMMLLFHAMQAALSMVYDRESGSMRVMLTSPAPRPFLLAARILAAVLTVLPAVYVFLCAARLLDVRPPWLGYLAALPALVLAGALLGSFGLLLSAFVRQLENFAGVMNFVIFPAFFISTALYPLWRLDENAPWVALLAQLNPFTYAVELIRFALYLQIDLAALAIVTGLTPAVFALACRAYDPGRGFWRGRTP